MSPKPFSGDVTWGCGYLRQICSVLVRVKRRVLPGMSTFRISNMKIDRTTPLRNNSAALRAPETGKKQEMLGRIPNNQEFLIDQ